MPAPTVSERVVGALYGGIGALAYGAAAAARALPGLSGPLREHLDERIGLYAGPEAAPGNGPVVWIHAASIGEVRAAEPLLRALGARHPRARLVVTCQTRTGRALARALGVERAHFAPLDGGLPVRRALDRFRPDLFLLVETEIWPCLLTRLARMSIPAAMVSARVSERSFSRYLRARRLFASPLATLARVCARDAESARRLVALGARAEVTTVCGDLKLAAIDESVVATTAPALGPLRDATPVVLAVSTHEGEDEIVLDAFLRLRRSHGTARLVIAPRHPERCAAVRAYAQQYLSTVVWSADRDALPAEWSVLVVDTTGEIYGFLRSAACGFVGGSLVPVGGHNLAEPAAFRVPVAVGPRTESVAHQTALLAGRGALVVVHDASELARAWQHWLDDPIAARRAGDAAHDAFVSSAGALERTLVAIEPLTRALRGARDART